MKARNLTTFTLGLIGLIAMVFLLPRHIESESIFAWIVSYLTVGGFTLGMFYLTYIETRK
jgi:hypothetical protein